MLISQCRSRRRVACPMHQFSCRSSGRSCVGQSRVAKVVEPEVGTTNPFAGGLPRCLERVPGQRRSFTVDKQVGSPFRAAIVPHVGLQISDDREWDNEMPDPCGGFRSLLNDTSVKSERSTTPNVDRGIGDIHVLSLQTEQLAATHLTPRCKRHHDSKMRRHRLCEGPYFPDRSDWTFGRALDPRALDSTWTGRNEFVGDSRSHDRRKDADSDGFRTPVPIDSVQRFRSFRTP